MRMRPDDRVPDRGKAVDFRSGRWKSALAATEIKHRAAPVNPLFDWLGQGIPCLGGAGEFGVAEGKAEQVGDFQSVEHGPAWRPSCVAHVAMPVLAGATDADWTGRPLSRWKPLRSLGRRDAPPLAEDVEFDLTKAAGEGDLLWGRNSLVTEENDGEIN